MIVNIRFGHALVRLARWFEHRFNVKNRRESIWCPRSCAGSIKNYVTLERSIEPGMCVRYLGTLVPASSSHSLFTFSLYRSCARRTERTCRREKGHPRPEKCSALGGWPLDTTNRYRPFDMDLGIGTAECKSSRRPSFHRRRAISKSAIAKLLEQLCPVCY